MLAEERLARIVEVVEQEGTATVAKLAELLGTSESTIRRDLDKLDQAQIDIRIGNRPRGRPSYARPHAFRAPWPA